MNHVFGYGRDFFEPALLDDFLLDVLRSAAWLGLYRLGGPFFQPLPLPVADLVGDLDQVAPGIHAEDELASLVPTVQQPGFVVS